MDIKYFINELNKLGINPTGPQLDQLKKYYELLVVWNKKVNLTAIIDEAEVYIKHFYDSLTISKITNLKTERKLCDIGTGAGFPGIVLKIFYPELEITLVDSLGKRIMFLDEVIKKLKLKKIETVQARAEDYARENRSEYDVVVARAVAKLNILLELCTPLLKKGGAFVAYKGVSNDEIEGARNALKLLNLRVKKTTKISLPKGLGERTLIKITKIGEISLSYPRKFSQIKNNPL